MKKAILIGGAGFIGRNIKHDLDSIVDKVITVDQSVDAGDRNSVRLSVRDEDPMRDLIKDNDVNVVIHLASSLIPASDGVAFRREKTEIIDPTFRLIDYCADNNILFVFVSSGGTVYGDAGSGIIREDNVLAPRSFYAFGKVVIEEYIRLKQRMSGLNYLILRPSNPYGRYQRLVSPQGFIAVALGKALRKEPLEIWGDGSVVRDYLDVRDLSLAVSSLIKRDVINATLNIGSGVGHSLNNVLNIIEDVVQRSVGVEYKAARSADVKSIVLDTRLLESLIPWDPKNLRDGIRDFYMSIR